LASGRPGGFPRTAFCFHDPKPSGASVWLREFLLNGRLPRHRVLAVLPGASPIEESLWSKRIPFRVLAVQQGSLMNAPARRKISYAVNRLAIIHQYRRLFRSERIDVVYVNSSFQIAPMIAAKLEGLPLVVHVHEGWHMGRSHWIKKSTVRRNARVGIFAAEAGRKLFGEAPRGAKWEVSPNGVSTSLARLKEETVALREEYGFAPNERIFLCLGTLSDRKVFHDLLEMWPGFHRRFPEARLLVAGGVDEAEMNEAIRAFPDSPPAGAEFLGYRTDAQRLIAAANCLVLPSYGEAMPITISEAMMIGTPIVARAVGDVAWQIGEGRGFLFKGKGAGGLRREMRRVICNPDVAGLRAMHAQDFARRQLSRQRQYKQIRSLVEWASREQ
jgi:glycosyltransferase involved in cell wall biosynthesis